MKLTSSITKQSADQQNPADSRQENVAPTGTIPSQSRVGLPNWFTHQFLRANRNLLWVNILLLLLTVPVALPFVKTMVVLLHGPYPIERDELLSLHNLSLLPKHEVTILADDVELVGHQSIRPASGEFSSSSGTDEPIPTDLLLLRIRNRHMVARVFPGVRENRISGRLVPISGQIRDKVLKPLEQANAEGHIVFLPFMLDVEPAMEESLLVSAFAAFLVPLGLFNVFRWVRRRRHPGLHPDVRRMARLGPVNDLVRDIEAQSAVAVFNPYDHYLLTPGWLMRPTFFGIRLYRVADIICAYLDHVHFRSNIYWVSKNRFIVHNRSGEMSGWACSTQEGVILLDRLRRIAPWICFQLRTNIAFPELVRWVDFNREQARSARDGTPGVHPPLPPSLTRKTQEAGQISAIKADRASSVGDDHA